MIAPDDTTFEYLEGRPARAGGLRRRGRRAGASCRPTTARASTPRSTVDAAALSPQVTWGTNPGDGRRRSPTRVPEPRRPSGDERALAYMGLEPGTPMQDIRARPRLHRLLHELAHRRPARGRRDRRGPHGRRRASTRWSCPGSAAGEARRPRPRGSTRSSAPPASTGARAGCSMCLGMNPDILQPGRALRLDLEPQLRGPPGPRRAHAPRVSPQMAAAAAIEGHFVDIREWS